MKHKEYTGMFEGAEPVHFKLAKEQRDNPTEAEKKTVECSFRKGIAGVKIQEAASYGRLCAGLLLS
jgi:hypothetical protein